MARKPLTGTVAANVLAHGTGALNIDGTRIGTDDELSNHGRRATENGWDPRMSGGQAQGQTPGQSMGRWPANVILDDEAAAMLDEQSGELHPPGTRSNRPDRSPFESGRAPLQSDAAVINDTGGPSRFFKVIRKDDDDQAPSDAADGASGDGDSGVELRPGLPGTSVNRTFYTAKVSRAERNRGLEHMRPVFAPTMGDGIGGREHSPDDERAYAANSHPTVKPVDLMQWLCRLVTPPKGTVLDPFTGSGSTGIAALREGFNFVGIEREAEYVEIARARIIGDAPLFNSITEGEQHG